MIKILFLIHDLGQGGAEKVLVNLVNNMDRTKFDITVMALFGGGVNEQFLKHDIRYITAFPKAFPGNSHVMKLFSPECLHKWLIKEKYDIEVSFLEGPCARIISGCQNKETKLLSWIHCSMKTKEAVTVSFRNHKEAESCYNRLDRLFFVSRDVEKIFLKNCNYSGMTEVLYNPIESNYVKEKMQEKVTSFSADKINLISVGSLKEVKGYDRLLRIVKKLVDEKYPVNIYILGIGNLEAQLKEYIVKNNLSDTVHLLGYQTNPYKYVAQSDLYICSSYSEGFSTAVIESLIVGTPVITTDVSGMKEILGENNEYGIVTGNSEEELYQGIRRLLDNDNLLLDYTNRAFERGNQFEVDQTVSLIEKVLEEVLSRTKQINTI